MKSLSPQQQFARYAAVVAACGLLGWGAAVSFAKLPAERDGALVGVALMVGTAFLSLWLKRRAVERNLTAALGAVVAVFSVRLVVLVAAVLLGQRAGLSMLAMVVGFFGEYFVLQVVEIRYVLAVHGRRSPAAPKVGWEGMS